MIKKKSNYIFLAFVLVILIGVQTLQHKEKVEEQTEIDSIISSKMEFYSPENIKRFKIDSFFFFREVMRHTKNQQVVLDENSYNDNYFIRLLDKNKYFPSISSVMPEIYPPGSENPNNEFARSEPIGGVMLKALYCDTIGYTDNDFAILKKLNHGDGSYWDTHFLIALLFLKSNNCFQPDKIEESIKQVSDNIINAEKTDKIFSDVYVERIVTLYWAGYGRSVDKKWIDFVKNTLEKEPGWEAGELSIYSYSHEISLALLSLIYWQEGKPKQFFY